MQPDSTASSLRLARQILDLIYEARSIQVIIYVNNIWPMRWASRARRCVPDSKS